MKHGNDQLLNIIEGCKKGDGECQKKLFEMYYGRMLGVCARYAANIDEAKDFAQEAFVIIFNKIVDYEGSGSFEGWMRRIMVNKSIDFLRRQKKVTFSIDKYEGYEPEDTEEDEDESMYSGISKEQIAQAIQKLPPAYRAVFNLYAIDGLTHNEIADELGISAGTSKSNLAKARAKLKKSLRKYLNYQDV